MTLGAAQEFRSYFKSGGRAPSGRRPRNSLLRARCGGKAAAPSSQEHDLGGASKGRTALHISPENADRVHCVNNKRIMSRNYSIQAHLSRISALLALHVHLRMVECTAGTVMPF